MDGRLAAPGRQLLAHPAGAAPAARAAKAFVAAAPSADGGVVLDYRLELPAAAAIVVAARGDVLPAERLWAYTCFEVFIARARQPGYVEYNFSPSGQWAAWEFSAYRQRRAAPTPPAPALDWQPPASRELPTALCLRARLPAAALPAGDGELEIGLAAVLLGADGETSFLALAHPGASPDFHARAGFCLRLDPHPSFLPCTPDSTD